MLLDPVKTIFSLTFSILILTGGIMHLRSSSPRLAVADFAEPLASAETLESVDANVSDLSMTNSGQDGQINKQNLPDNAIIEAEDMTTSIEQNSPNNNSDWSLEIISDQALEITR